MTGWIESAQGLIVQYGGQLLLAIVVLIVGLWLIGRITKELRKTMDNKGIDPSLAPFLESITGVLLKVMLVISVAGMVGIQMTSFVAVLGACGLAVGLALQGSLGNFAGGVLILILKPFKVGDLIEFDGNKGFVREIQIFMTKIETFEHVIHIIPNAPLSSGTVSNFSEMPTKRQDWVFGISYASDIDKAKSIIAELAAAEHKVLKDPAPDLFVSELADSSVNITLRVWVNNDDAPAAHTILAEKVKKAFDAQNISIPFPQVDVHMHGNG